MKELDKSLLLPGMEVKRVMDYFPKNDHLRKLEVTIGGKAVNRALLLRQNEDGDTEFLNFSRKGYKLVPNERVLKMADKVAAEFGATPFEELGSNVIYTKDRRQIHCIYKLGEPVKFKNSRGKPEEIQLGFSVHSSIDTSLGFGAGAFSYRIWCQNMVFMLVKAIKQGSDQMFASTYHKHTKNFDPSPEALRRDVKGVIERSLKIRDAYVAWTKEKFNLELAYKLVKTKMPLKYLPEWLEVDEEDHTRIRITALKDPTKWQAYNDITEEIWHNDTTDTDNKILQFARVHTAFDMNDYGWG